MTFIRLDWTNREFAKCGVWSIRVRHITGLRIGARQPSLRRVGTNAIHVPYRGGGQALAELVAGQPDFTFEGPTIVKPMADAGRLRALASTGAQRMSTWPSLPVAGESERWFAENDNSVGAEPAQDFADFVRAEHRRWREFVREIGLPIQWRTEAASPRTASGFVDVSGDGLSVGPAGWNSSFWCWPGPGAPARHGQLRQGRTAHAASQVFSSRAVITIATRRIGGQALSRTFAKDDGNDFRGRQAAGKTRTVR